MDRFRISISKRNKPKTNHNLSSENKTKIIHHAGGKGYTEAGRLMYSTNHTCPHRF
jgi:hypothetical protein